MVSYIQASKEADRIECRITMDFADLANCQLQPLSPTTQQQPPIATSSRPPVAATTTTAAMPKKTGLLGKLVSGAQRTQQSMLATAKLASTTTGNSDIQASTTAKTNSLQFTTGNSNAAAALQRTAQQVLADFREAMQQKMLDFELAPDESIRVELSLPEYTAGLDLDDQTRVTMDVLKYMVYEAAEEVNEEWIAHKEPNEFMDECVITVYKEDAAPPEVLEEMNRAELPEEVRGQERAMAQERQRQLERQNMQQQKRAQDNAHKRQVHEEADEFEALNTQKRDRRTIADYEREKRDR